MGERAHVVSGVYSLGASDLEWTIYGQDYARLVVVLKLNGCAVNAHLFTANSQNWTPSQTSLGDSVMSISLSTIEPTPAQLGSLIVNSWSVTSKMDGQLTLANVAVVSWDQQGKRVSDMFESDDRPHPMVRTN